MKTMTLIRHAKSSWKEPMLQDMDRPLNKRGQANAVMMGERLRRHQYMPEKIYSSPAVRAEETAHLFEEVLKTRVRNIVELAPAINTFNYEDLLDWIRLLDQGENNFFMVCHNPAITDLFNFLTLSHIEKIPTCGVAVLELHITNWSQLGAGKAWVKFYDFPKSDKKPSPLE
jgi:phosphohistidine phosphatase